MNLSHSAEANVICSVVRLGKRSPVSGEVFLQEQIWIIETNVAGYHFALKDALCTFFAD